jgi:hypothetical protein
MFSGKMTERQKLKAQNKCKIRTDKLLAAVDWLCCNHKTWKTIDRDEIRKAVKDWKPIIVDSSVTVNNSSNLEHANIEETESFSCYFPDGTLSDGNGGLDDPSEFKKLVEETQRRGFEVEFQYDVEKHLVNDYEEDNFVNTSLLQFPYGIGGMNEPRRKSDGSQTCSLNVSEYIEHLTRMSRPDFHRPLFVLILYSIQIRQQMLRTSKFVLREKQTASTLANGLRVDDLDNSIWFHRRGVRSGTRASRTLLEAVNSCSRALPHTKEAAEKAEVPRKPCSTILALAVGS